MFLDAFFHSLLFDWKVWPIYKSAFSTGDNRSRELILPSTHTHELLLGPIPPCQGAVKKTANRLAVPLPNHVVSLGLSFLVYQIGQTFALLKTASMHVIHYTPASQTSPAGSTTELSWETEKHIFFFTLSKMMVVGMRLHFSLSPV